MGEYFHDICKFYDDDTTKEQFHCNDCGICRIGGRDKFYHCKKCVNYQSSHCSSFPTPPPHSGFKTKNQNFGTGALVDRDFLPRGPNICTQVTNIHPPDLSSPLSVSSRTGAQSAGGALSISLS
ncbi:hypothetical protein ACFX12_025539 [Malus domestica]